VLWLGFGAAIGLIVVRRLALRRDDPIAERVTGRVNRVAVGAVTSDVFQDLRNFTTLLLAAALLVGIGAYLAGRPAWLGRLMARASEGSLIRRDFDTIRWIGDCVRPLQVALVVVGALVLLFAEPRVGLVPDRARASGSGVFLLTYLRDRVRAPRSACP
jgi:hypothetical protein